MEKTSPPLDVKTASPVSPQSPFMSHSPPSDRRTQQFASNFTTLYHSIFPPKPSPLPASLSITPSTSSPSSSATTSIVTTDDFSTEDRLRQARLILEYQELCEHYELSLSRLQILTAELESLRRENNELRVANNELVKLLSLSSQAAIQRNRFSDGDFVSDFASKSVIEPSRFERRISPNAPERVTLPKSISIRTADYLKLNQAGPNNGGSSTNSTRPRVPSQLDELINKPQVQQRVYVPGVGRSKEENSGAVELEVYNQGTWKTELCNKWQETGTCPYGDHCQFAHGITELRPVIRHPRYKTQVCRMVLAGESCPYGHRCHFRHSLTEQERLVGPR